MGPMIFHKTKHLDENQLMPEDLVCRFCGSRNSAPVAILQENPQIWLRECYNCHAASASRIPKTQELEGYYKNYYISNSSNTHHQKITFDGAERLARHFVSKITGYLLTSSVNILDFGGGDGSIAIETANQLLRVGFEKIAIVVVDYNELLVNISDPCISLTHETTLDDLSVGNYDFIIASAIIEHLPQPGETLKQLMNLLCDGGIFYARTPYVLPFIKLFRLLGLKWDFTYPAHLHDLKPAFWETFFKNILANDHFRVIATNPSIVKASLKTHFFKSFAAYLCKAPWYLIGNSYKMVGGWEIFVRKETTSLSEK